MASRGNDRSEMIHSKRADKEKHREVYSNSHQPVRTDTDLFLAATITMRAQTLSIIQE